MEDICRAHEWDEKYVIRRGLSERFKETFVYM